jgi:drug/metabolite transporter (DMT)-like permease
MTRKAWIVFAAVSVIWGVPYLFIRIAVRHGIPPFALAWGRIALGSIVLLVLARQAGTLHTLKGRWRWLAAYAIAEVTIPFPAIAFGETRISSSLAAIIVAAVPLIGALLALRFDHAEKPTRIRFIGLLTGFVGVIVLVGVDVAGSGRALLGTGVVLLAALGYAIGPMLIKHRMQGLDARAMMGAALAISAVILTPAAIIDAPSHTPSAGALASVAVLGVLCTAAGLVLLAVLVREAGTSRAMVITYINPVIAVALGVALLNERPGAGAVAGLLLILAGSYLSTGGKLPPRLRSGRRVAQPAATRT